MNWLFDFRGRATRLDYWRMQLLGAVMGGAALALSSFAIMAIGRIGGLLMLILAPVLVASLAMAVRRLHDRSKSGWWLLIFSGAPFTSAALLTELPQLQYHWSAWPLAIVAWGVWIWGGVEIGLLAGVKGANRYGADRLPR